MTLKAYIHRFGRLLEKSKSESLNRDSSADCGLDFEGRVYCIALLVETFVFRALYPREFARVLVDSLNLVFCVKLCLSCKGSSEIVQFEVQTWQNPLGCPWICQI